MSNSILSDRRILRRRLHYETVIQSSKSPMITFLASDKKKTKNCLSIVTRRQQFAHSKSQLLSLLVVVLKTKTDLNERSFPPKRRRADIITKLTSLTSFSLSYRMTY